MKAELRFLADVCVGVGLGIIFARQSGKKTRESIRSATQSALDEAASTTARIANQVKGAAVKGREEFAAAVEAGKKAYQSAGG